MKNVIRYSTILVTATIGTPFFIINAMQPRRQLSHDEQRQLRVNNRSLAQRCVETVLDRVAVPLTPADADGRQMPDFDAVERYAAYLREVVPFSVRAYVSRVFCDRQQRNFHVEPEDVTTVYQGQQFAWPPSVAINRSGTHAAYGYAPGLVGLYDLAAGVMAAICMGDRERQIRTVAVNDSADCVAAGCSGGAMQLWCRPALGQRGAGDGGVVDVDAVAEWRDPEVVEAFNHDVCALQFDAEQRALICGMSNADVGIWDLEHRVGRLLQDNVPVARELGRDQAILCLDVLDRPARLVTGTHNGVVRLWNLAVGGPPLMRWQVGSWLHPLKFIGFDRTGARLVAGVANGSVHTYDHAAGAEVVEQRPRDPFAVSHATRGLLTHDPEHHFLQLYDTVHGSGCHVDTPERLIACAHVGKHLFWAGYNRQGPVVCCAHVPVDYLDGRLSIEQTLLLNAVEHLLAQNPENVPDDVPSVLTRLADNPAFEALEVAVKKQYVHRMQLFAGRVVGAQVRRTLPG